MKKFFCKISCVCLIATLILSMNVASSAQLFLPSMSGEFNESGTFASKNLATGDINYYTLEANVSTASLSGDMHGEYIDARFPCKTINADSQIMPSSIIGSDDRLKVEDTVPYPYSAICYIEISWPDGSTGLGTAWIIYDNLAVTAGHCIYSADHGGWASKVKLWPGKNGYGLWNNPYGTTTAISLNTSSEWVTSEDENQDWAIMELADAIGEKTGCFGFGWTPYSLTDEAVTISGYPGEHRYYQYKMSGSITDSSTYKLCYNAIDTSGGQSGSPIYNSVHIVYGIHCYGGTSTNSGTRITKRVYDFFLTFME